MNSHSILLNNVQECQSFTGELGQFLDQETRDVCESAPSFIMMSLIGIIAGIIMIVIGGVISAVGAIRKSPMQALAAEPGRVVGSPIQPTETEDRSNVDNGNQSSLAKSDILSIADELSKLLALKEKGVLSDEKR